MRGLWHFLLWHIIECNNMFCGCFCCSDVEEDVPLLKAALQQILGELGVTGANVQDDYVAEMCR